jgi:hypothetical protein
MLLEGWLFAPTIWSAILVPEVTEDYHVKPKSGHLMEKNSKNGLSG